MLENKISHHQTIAQLFERNVAQYPENPALECNGLILSYASLNAKANLMAHHLERFQLKPGEVVAVMMVRSEFLIVSILGVLKAGAAYLPISTDCPEQRLKTILADSGARVLIVDDGFASSDLPTPCLSANQINWSERVDGLAPCHTRPDDLAYVIYTSGSSGKPKGVMVEQRQLLNLVSGFYDLYDHNLGPGDRCLSYTQISFDVFVAETFLPLCLGATMVLLPPTELFDVLALTRTLNQQMITFCYIPPGLLTQVSEGLEPNAAGFKLNKLLVGVEPIVDTVLQAFLDINPQMHIINGYGPTETTILATGYHYRSRVLDGKPVPIGKAIANTSVVLVDENNRIVPQGQVGEICICGAGVARGYLNQPELTAQSFQEDRRVCATRFYKSGDLARELPDGNLQFVGRLDNQLKLRGYRVELGEIEYAIRDFGQVRETCVDARQVTGNHKQVVAYYVADTQIDPKQLEAHLKKQLPSYMIPMFYVQLEQFTMNAHGKIDRTALPTPLAEDCGQQVYETPTQTKLAHIIGDLFGVSGCGEDTDFFELGMHSLITIKLLNRIADVFEKTVAAIEIYHHPTIQSLAAHLDQLPVTSAQAAVLPYFSAERPEWIPLTFQQQQIWFLHQFDTNATAYNFQFKLHIQGPLDTKILADTFNLIIERHEIYRTTFVDHNGNPGQFIQPPWQVELEVIDLRGEDPGQCRMEDLIRDGVGKKFDFGELPFIEWKLFRMADAQYVLLQYEHHFVHDGVSFGLFLSEMKQIYAMYHRGEDPRSLPMPNQYADFALWQQRQLQGAYLEQRVQTWAKKLEKYPTTSLIQGDFKRPARQTFRGGRVELDLDEDFYEALDSFSQKHGVTLFATMFSAFAALVYRYTHQQDLLIGTSFSNRARPETESIIGMLVNNMIIPISVAKDLPFSSWVAQNRDTISEAQAFQDIPYAELVNSLNPERRSDINPLCQLSFNFHDSASPRLNFAGLEADYHPVQNNSSKFDMNVIVIPRAYQQMDHQHKRDKRLHVLWEYNTDLFKPETVQTMIQHYQNLLKSAIRQPQQLTPKLNLFTAEERELLLRQEHRVPTSCALMHQQFERQAAAHPKKIAVTCQDQTLTYGELNRRANQLAGLLIERGVAADIPVGLCVPRSSAIPIGILGILKAGGTYVPLDPEYPSERLAYILADCGAKILVTSGQTGDWDIETLALDGVDWFARQENPKVAELTPDCGAYVIYTSGSTGHPKGVRVTHRNVASLFEASQTHFNFGPDDVWTLFHSYAFDFSVWELWGALIYGGRLVIVPGEVARAAAEFCRLLVAEKVTVLNQTPSAFTTLMAQDLPTRWDLRYVIFGGEMLEPTRLEAWFERYGDDEPELINMYGITETTVHVTYRRLKAADCLHGRSVIGRPLPHLTAYVCSPEMEPVPMGVAGELLVGGAGLARGYLNQPELTRERFIEHPFAHTQDQRLYRSGDLVRGLANGELEYLGRIDHQVKIRGFRIELAEIEAELTNFEPVRDAVVVVRADEKGDKQLVGFVVLHAPEMGSGDLHAGLQDHLKRNLPQYMIPATFAVLECLPLTSNGKIDRKALAGYNDFISTGAPYQAPEGATQVSLVAIWQKLLARDKIGVVDNFFELGGHSLRVVRLINEIHKQFGVRLDVKTVFDHPQIIHIAEALEAIMWTRKETRLDACYEEVQI